MRRHSSLSVALLVLILAVVLAGYAGSSGPAATQMPPPSPASSPPAIATISSEVRVAVDEALAEGCAPATDLWIQYPVRANRCIVGRVTDCHPSTGFADYVVVVTNIDPLLARPFRLTPSCSATGQASAPT